MNIQVRGGVAFQQKLQAAAQESPIALVAALFQEAETVMTLSKRDYVPVDTGALRTSGHVEPPISIPQGGSVTLGYGGPSAPYAVIVHEDLTKRHPVGGAKYLELPLRARLQGMPVILGQKTGAAIRKAFAKFGKV